MSKLHIDTSRVQQIIIRFIQDQMRHTGFEQLVIGLSGGGFDCDAVRRTSRRAQHASHAFHAALLVAVEPMDAAIVLRQDRFYFRILLRHRAIIGYVAERRLQALHDRGQKRRLPEADLRLFDPGYVFRVNGHAGGGCQVSGVRDM